MPGSRCSGLESGAYLKVVKIKNTYRWLTPAKSALRNADLVRFKLGDFFPDRFLVRLT
jgi:hypothetical protein